MCSTELSYIVSGKINSWRPGNHTILEKEGKAHKKVQ
jgi:hypothetical protein